MPATHYGPRADRPATRERPCIACRAPIQSEGPHHRMCAPCRAGDVPWLPRAISAGERVHSAPPSEVDRLRAALGLTAMQARILAALLAAEGRPCGLARLGAAVGCAGGPKTLSVHVAAIRERLKDRGLPGAIGTTHGKGYWIAPDQAAALRALAAASA